MREGIAYGIGVLLFFTLIIVATLIEQGQDHKLIQSCLQSGGDPRIEYDQLKECRR